LPAPVHNLGTSTCQIRFGAGRGACIGATLPPA